MNTPRLIDRMNEYPVAVNELICSGCGERLYPDCDASSASIAEEWERHLAERHA